MYNPFVIFNLPLQQVYTNKNPGPYISRDEIHTPVAKPLDSLRFVLHSSCDPEGSKVTLFVKEF